MTRKLRIGLGAALVLLVLVFALQNNEQVSVAFLFWHVSMPRSLLLMLPFVAGVGVGWILRHRPRGGKGKG